jgi:histidine triad (HIT) family protein
MSEDCIFCGIVDGAIPGHVVYEDDTTLAFLDANPLARGHTLVIPKDHHARLDDLPAGLAADVFATVHTVVPAVEAAVDAPATTVAFNNGEAAGQEVPHVHGHVVPRDTGDGAGPVHALFDDRPAVDDDELAAIRDAIEDHRH